jgi:esterase/lipase
MDEEKSKIHFILVAGLSADDKEAFELKKTLREKGYGSQTLSFYGEKYIDDFTDLKISDCLKNISETINKAAEKYNFIYGIGISLGGALLLEYAKTQNNLKGIISIGTPIKLKKRFLVSVAQKLYPLIYPLWKKLQKIKSLRLMPIGAGTMVIEYIEKDFVKDLEKIKTPALLLHSKKDRVSDYRVLPHFFKRLASERKQLYFFENGRHVIDEDPQTIANCALAFLGLNQEGPKEGDNNYLTELVLDPKI